MGLACEYILWIEVMLKLCRTEYIFSYIQRAIVRAHVHICDCVTVCVSVVSRIHGKHCHRSHRDDRRIEVFTLRSIECVVREFCRAQGSICETPSGTSRHSNINISFVRSLQNAGHCEHSSWMQSLRSHRACSIHLRRHSLAALHGALVPQALLPFAPRSRQLYGVWDEDGWKIVGH